MPATPTPREVLELRKNSNQILATVIWGNVSTNVLLTLLSDAVLAGLGAFFFSAVVITLLCGNISASLFFAQCLADDGAISAVPEFLSRRLVSADQADRHDARLVARHRGHHLFRERDIRSLIARSAASGGDIGKLEAIGARNFLDLDDVPVTDEGEVVHAESIISLPQANNRCVLPNFDRTPDDAFLRKIDASGKKWVIVTDLTGEPVFVLDSHQFLRDALFDELEINPNDYWHRPHRHARHEDEARRCHRADESRAERPDDDVIDNDLILVWGEQKRIITGADLLGRLLRGIVAVDGAGAAPHADRGAQASRRSAGQARAPRCTSARFSVDRNKRDTLESQPSNAASRRLTHPLSARR